MESKGSLAYSEESATCPYIKPYQSCPPTHSYFISSRSALLLSSHPCLDDPCGLPHSGLLTKTLYAFFFSSAKLHAQPILSPLIWSPELCFLWSTDHEATHYVIFSSLLSLSSTEVQISPAAPYSWTPLAYIFLTSLFYPHVGKQKNHCTYS